MYLYQTVALSQHFSWNFQ